MFGYMKIIYLLCNRKTAAGYQKSETKARMTVWAAGDQMKYIYIVS